MEYTDTLLYNYYYNIQKVFSASGLDLVTRTRVDHLPDSEKEKHKS